jgi:uncharacterized paraquat-inducible protein A
MPQYDSDEYLDDYEDFDDDITRDDEEVDLVECPECGAEVYEDSVQCPVCGSYVTHSTSVWQGKSLQWVVLGLLGIVAVIYVLTMTMW